ncbi:MAG TPA: GxxExxY protein, partial [Chitinophagaceae bacterium]|nr:GxxExxY protein [Chitinophagaceae bacterium]
MKINHGVLWHRATRRKGHKPLTEREKWLAAQIVDIAISIHRFLGPGLLESIYEKCFCYELSKKHIPFVTQKCVDLIYDGLIIGDGLRIDILVDDLIVVELKAQEMYHPVCEAQLLSYLKLTNKRLGYILNFHIPLMK